MIAVVKVAGKQFVAEVGKKLKIDSKLENKNSKGVTLGDKKIKLSDILFVADDKKINIGKPLIAGASIEGEIISEAKGKKVLIVKHHPKKRYRRTVGHRQDQTIISISKINLNEKK